ncbi:NYN domain-containing protein [bacterium]|nr:NYN domain-containing protein [bacterium]
MPTQPPSPEKGYAAVFVDFENVFYYLKSQYTDLPDLTEYTLELIRNLRVYLEQELGLAPIVRYAYADFERLAAAPLGSLYLMGIEIRNVMGVQHKNAADMRLCIDAMQILYTRPDIEAFVFVAGDRDYIPVIQHIQTQAKTVKAVAFRGNLSGDLLQNIGDDNFVDATSLFDEESLKRLEKEAAYARLAEQHREQARKEALEAKKPEPQAVPEQNTEPVKPQKESVGSRFRSPVPVVTEDQKRCLDLMLTEYGSHPEIWLSPFLRKLTDVLPALADFERKNILYDLEQFGAICVEQRKGEPYDYRVILVNYNHPTVRELNPG